MKRPGHYLLLPLVILALLGLGACEKMILNEEEEENVTKDGNVTIKVSMYNIVPFDSRAAQSLTDYCSTIQFVFYQNDKKIKAINQKSGDATYGQTTLSLSPGTYQLLVLAHSCPFGNPTLSTPSKIQFTNTGSGYSDVFYYYNNIEVTDEPKTHNLELERATSMVSITIIDEMPQEVAKIRLKYEGESGVFNAMSGWGGSVNSEQYVMYNVQGRTAPLTLKAYTFLRNETGALDMTISAYDAENTPIAEKELTGIPMKNRMVTEYSGNLFSESNSGLEISLTADTEWSVYKQLTF